MPFGFPMGGAGAAASGLGGFGKILSAVNPYLGAALGGFELVKDISGLFKPSVQGLQKIQATKFQQSYEQQGKSIEEAVNNGSLDPQTALTQLRSLIRQVAGGGGNQFDQAGQKMALLNLNQIYSNVMNARNWSLAKPADKSGGMGLAGVSNNPDTQKMWAQQAIREKLLGFDAGNQKLAGSPMADIAKPAFDVYGNADTAMQKAQQFLPNYQEPSGFDAIRRKLMGV